MNYHYRDHLGNTRLSFTADTTGQAKVVAEHNYYPFGLKHEGYNRHNRTGYNYLYNGKEWLADFGIYYYGFRIYIPSIGRFPSIDPISDKFPHVSPYNYAENEPISSIDLWGLQRWIVNGRERNKPMPKWRTDARTGGFAIRHPIAANRIGKGGRGSTNITGVAGRYARHFAESTETSKAIGSKSNALRHAIWSSAIRSEFNAIISKRATNAHEGIGIAESQSVDFTKEFNGKGNEGLELADHIVDVLNNEIGFSLAESNPNVTIGELAIIALKEFKENGLWMTSKDRSGSITITKTKLSEKEYERALEHFNTLNEYGFTKEEQQQIDKEKNR